MAALAGSPLALLSADLPISYLHHLELELPDAPIFVGQAAFRAVRGLATTVSYSFLQAP